LFEHLTGLPFQFNWWQVASAQNIQIDLQQQLLRLAERSEAIAKLRAEVAAALRAPTAPTFLRIGAEPWEAFVDEAEDLANAHNREVYEGTMPKLLLDRQQLAALSAANAVLTLSARANGRLIGYLLWTIGRDPEASGQLVAYQGPWYVLPDWGRVGLRLFKASLPLLRRWHPDRLEIHHPVRGRGATLSAWFTRLGATPIHIRYSLPMPPEGDS
jgi:hypothetical protein